MNLALHGKERQSETSTVEASLVPVQLKFIKSKLIDETEMQIRGVTIFNSDTILILQP